MKKEINYELWHDGRPVAIITRKEGQMETDECPFCGNKHDHGTLPGHRVTHCSSPDRTVTASDGTELSSKNGYIIKHY